MSRRMHPPSRDHWLVLEYLLVLRLWLFTGFSEKHTNVEQIVAVGYYKSVLIAFLVDKGNLALFTGLGSVQVTMQQSGRRGEGSP